MYLLLLAITEKDRMTRRNFPPPPHGSNTTVVSQPGSRGMNGGLTLSDQTSSVASGICLRIDRYSHQSRSE